MNGRLTGGEELELLSVYNSPPVRHCGSHDSNKPSVSVFHSFPQDHSSHMLKTPRDATVFKGKMHTERRH